MVTKLLLNVSAQEVRVAIIENDRLAELYSQRKKNEASSEIFIWDEFPVCYPVCKRLSST